MLLTDALRNLFRARGQDVPATLSVVLNFYNNRREARNALHSLTRDDQISGAAARAS